MVRTRIRGLLPWLLASALLGYLFYTISFEELGEALLKARLWCLFATVFFVDMGSLLGDSWGTSRVFSWYLAPVTFRELLPVRAATYLMAILNYNLGQAGLIYYMHRAKGVSVLQATGVMLMMMGTVILLLAVLSLAGIFLATDEATRRFSMLLGSLGLLALLYFGLLRLRPALLDRVALFRPLFEAGVYGHLKSTLVRIPHIGVIVFAHVLGMRCFGIEVPLAAGLVYIPSVLLVAALPLTPFGLGTMQMTAVHFFAPYAPGPSLAARQALVFAYSLSLATLALMLQAVMGLVCLKRVSSLISKPEEREALKNT